MRTFDAGPGGTIPPSSTTYAFTRWTPTTPGPDLVEDRRRILVDALEVAFRSWSATAEPTLRAVAAAFHAATSGLTAVGTNSSTITYA
jgi:hypothetical protein